MTKDITWAKLIIQPDGTEEVPPEIVEELDKIMPAGTNNVDLAALLLKLTGRVQRNL